MRTTLPAAAPFSGSLGSFPIACPAQAAARDLPGRRERKAGRGKTSLVRHGAVWENPGEAAQRAGKGYGDDRRVGGFAWGVVEFVSAWPHSLPAGQVPLGPHFRGLPLHRGARGGISKEAAVAKESLAPSALHRGAESRIKSFGAPAPGAEVARRFWPQESLSPARVGTSRPEPFPGRRPAPNARLRTVGAPAGSPRVDPRVPCHRRPFPLTSCVKWEGLLPFSSFPALQRDVDCRHVNYSKDPTGGNGTKAISGPGFELRIYL